MKRLFFFFLIIICSKTIAQEVTVLDSTYFIKLADKFPPKLTIHKKGKDSIQEVNLNKGRYSLKKTKSDENWIFDIDEKGQINGEVSLSNGNISDIAYCKNNVIDSIREYSTREKVLKLIILFDHNNKKTVSKYFDSEELSCIKIYEDIMGRRISETCYFSNGILKSHEDYENEIYTRYNSKGKLIERKIKETKEEYDDAELIKYKYYSEKGKSYKEYYEKGIIIKKETDDEEWLYENGKLISSISRAEYPRIYKYTYDSKGKIKSKEELPTKSQENSETNLSGTTDLDNDKDGTLNSQDVCPNTYGVENSPLGKGCPMPIIDTDADGIIDAEDKCPKVPAKTGRYYGTVGLGCPEKPTDIILTKPEIPAKYKVNWINYVAKNTEEYDDGLTGIEGKIVVQFIVNLEGCVSEVKAISGPLELRKEAERIVRASSGKWEPAVDKGQKVEAYSSTEVTFQLK